MLKIETLPEFLETDLASTQEFISRRTQNSQKIFYAVYGDNLDKVLDLTKLPNRYIDSFETTLKSVKKAFIEKKFFLADILQCPIETFINNIDKFKLSTNDINLLQKIFGPDYQKPYDMHQLSMKEMTQYNSLIILLKEKIAILNRENNYDLTYNGKSILNILRCSKEELKIFKLRVLDNRKKIRYAFYLAFGSNLDNKANLLLLDEQQMKDFLEGVKEGRQIILNYREMEKEEEVIKHSGIKKTSSPKIEIPPIKNSKSLMEILNCSKKEITCLLNKMDDLNISYDILRKVMDSNYYLNLEKLKKTELKIFSKTIKELKKLQKQFLWNILNSNYEKVMLLTAKLNSYRKDILIKAFGPNFDQIKDLSKMTEKEKNSYCAIIKLMHNGLNNKAKTLMETLNCSYFDVLTLMDKSKVKSNQYQVLVKAHGKHFNEVKNIYLLTADDCKVYNTAIYLYHQALASKKENLYLYEDMNCCSTDLTKAFLKMDKSSFYYQILAKVYNQDWKLKMDLNSLTYEECKDLIAAKKYLHKLLEKIVLENNPTLIEILNCSMEELDIMLPYLSNIQLDALKNIFGENLLQERNLFQVPAKEKSNYYNAISKLKQLYQLIFIDKKDISNSRYSHKLYLNEIIGCTYEELLEMINFRSEENLSAKTLIKVHGTDLKKPKDMRSLTKQEESIYYSVIGRVKKKYKKQLLGYEGKYLYEIIGCEEKVLKELMKNIEPKYYDYLKTLFGPNLDKLCPKIKKDEKQKIDAIIKIIKPIETNIILNLNEEQEFYIKIPAIPSLIPFLPQTYQKIVNLYLILKDVSKVSQILNQDENYIRRSLNIIYSWFNDVAINYSNTFSEELRLSKEENLILNLKKK